MNSDIDRQVRYFDSFKSACVYAKHQAIKNKKRYRIKKRETKSALEWKVQAEDLEKVYFNEANDKEIRDKRDHRASIEAIKEDDAHRLAEEMDAAEAKDYADYAKDQKSYWVDWWDGPGSRSHWEDYWDWDELPDWNE